MTVRAWRAWLIALLLLGTAARAPLAAQGATEWPAALGSRVFDGAALLEPGHAVGLDRVLTRLQQHRQMDWRVVTYQPDATVDTLALTALADTLRVLWHLGDQTAGRGGLLLITVQELETGRRRRFHASVTPALAGRWTPWWTGPEGRDIQEQVRTGATVEAFQRVVDHLATYPRPLSWPARLLAVALVAGPVGAGGWVWQWRRRRRRLAHPLS